LRLKATKSRYLQLIFWLGSMALKLNLFKRNKECIWSVL
jgi:hypothetical protein